MVPIKDEDFEVKEIAEILHKGDYGTLYIKGENGCPWRIFADNLLDVANEISKYQNGFCTR